MSFQAYIDNIKEKTGKTPEDFMKIAKARGLLKANMKGATLVKLLKDEFDLGQGHSMAIWAVFKSKGWVNDPKKK